MEPTNRYKTNNFYLSAYLSTQGFDLIGIEQEDERRSLFIFADRADREAVIKRYLFGKRALVDARRFVSAVKELKAKLYANKDKSENVWPSE